MSYLKNRKKLHCFMEDQGYKLYHEIKSEICAWQIWVNKEERIHVDVGWDEIEIKEDKLSWEFENECNELSW